MLLNQDCTRSTGLPMKQFFILVIPQLGLTLQNDPGKNTELGKQKKQRIHNKNELKLNEHNLLNYITYI